MNWTEYTSLIDPIIEKKNRTAPYDQIAYVEYVTLNKSRINRWLKKNPLSEETKEALQRISEPLQWILITEPWCGDAAHSTPIIHLMAEQSDNIDLQIVLRDQSDLIDSYLTNGGKSIPILIVRDAEGNDLFTWGPRPEACQNLVMELKNSDASPQSKNMQVQMWYNKDQGQSIQRELIHLLKNNS